MEIWMNAIPRDRKGDYEPQVVKKYQNTVTQDMEEKILSMYAKGMTTGDIESTCVNYTILIFLTVQSAGSQIKSCRL